MIIPFRSHLKENKLPEDTTWRIKTWKNRQKATTSLKKKGPWEELENHEMAASEKEE
jgi:hypothetical protein